MGLPRETPTAGLAGAGRPWPRVAGRLGQARQRSLEGLPSGAVEACPLGCLEGPSPRALCQAQQGEAEVAQETRQVSPVMRPQENGLCALRGLNTETGRETLFSCPLGALY